MCDLQTLAQTFDGYIVRCAECNRMQLSFGPVAVIIKEGQFRALRRKATLEAQLWAMAVPDKETKVTTLRLNSVTMLCLSVEELDGLLTLLDQASVMLEAYKIIEVSPLEG